MKRYYLLFLAAFVFCCSCSKEDSNRLPDVDDVCTKMEDITFMQYCYDNYDVNKDGKVSIIEAEAVKEIHVEEKRITSLNGIGYFKNIVSLMCYNNPLTKLDISKNTALIELYCGGNQLTTLDVSKNTALELLECWQNQLTSLDISKNTALIKLYCSQNKLTSLDVSNNTKLTLLDCESNQLTSLDVSKNTALERLYCSDNKITSLDVSNCSPHFIVRVDESTSVKYKEGQEVYYK